MAHKTDHVQISVWLPKKEAAAIKKRAARNERSVTAEVRNVVRLSLQEDPA